MSDNTWRLNFGFREFFLGMGAGFGLACVLDWISMQGWFQ